MSWLSLAILSVLVGADRSIRATNFSRCLGNIRGLWQSQRFQTSGVRQRHIAADDAQALAIIRGESAPTKAGRRPGALAAAILNELRSGAKSPRELVEACGEYINSTTNKGAIMSQKLAAMRKQTKILNPSKGVWKLPDEA
ncbi:MAG: hypothetical protein IIB55_07195 [Planctomycetes bacterium]|nr:hypothetical protein [Planctomycetota bacterium]